MTFARTATRFAALVSLVALAACSDPIAKDLRALNAAGQAAMASANVQQNMAKVQSATTNEQRAALLRETATALSGAQAQLQAVSMSSKEGKGIQAKMAGGFAKAAGGSASAAEAMEKSSGPTLEAARVQIRDGQTDIIAAGSEMVKLAKERSIDLNKTP